MGQSEESAAIDRVIAALSHRVTPAEVAGALADEVQRAVAAEAVTVFLFDEEGRRIVLVRGVGTPADTASVVPLKAGDRVLGCLAVSWGRVLDDEAQRRFLVTVARRGAPSLARARLFEASQAAREAAEAARRELEALVYELPVAVACITADGHAQVNARNQAIWGSGFREGQTYVPPGAMRHPDGRPFEPAELPVAVALRGQAVVGQEMLITREDNGEERRLRIDATPLKNEAGEITSAVAVFSDVTAEHRVAEELRASERRYGAVLRATNDIIWEYTPQTGRLEWNGALERVLGYSAEETNRHPDGGLAWWGERVHPDDRAAVVAAFEAAQASGAPGWTAEYRFQRADGTYVPMLDRCVFERDPAGKSVRIIGAISDVSEQQRLFAELRDAVRVRDDFLSIAGHELRTPLAALSAQLTGLQLIPLDEARRRAKLAAAERQVRRLGALADELLNVSRIVNGRFQLEREPVELGALVRDAAARLADEFQRAGVPLEIVAAEPVHGRWDRLRLDLVVTNLLTNALRYGERRPVRVCVGADGELARITVEDQGIGIRAEDQQRIFERFVRAVPERQFGGLGIGLWLAREVVDAHGGRVAVKSAPGQGATFTVELPR